MSSSTISTHARGTASSLALLSGEPLDVPVQAVAFHRADTAGVAR
jgi:hypothetical protein